MRRMELQQEASLYHGDAAGKSHDATAAAVTSAAARRRKVLHSDFSVPFLNTTIKKTINPLLELI